MTVLNKHRLPGKVIPPGAVYIGRGSKWGNPFVIGVDGTREEVIQKYRELVERELRTDVNHVYARELAKLSGKDLVCFCAPQACHGDVLAMYAAECAQYLAFEIDHAIHQE